MTKGILLGVLVFIILGLSTTSILGFENIARFFHMPLAMKPDASIPYIPSVEGCDQNSTSTPCSEIEAMAKAYIPPQQTTQETPLITYGALTQTYTDASTGFILKYPGELRIENGGDVVLNDRRDSKHFAVKVCVPGSPCASGYTKMTINSLQSFEQNTVSPYGQSATHGQMTYKQIPTQNSILTTPSGHAILKQNYTSRVFDSKGNDITQSACEECGSGLRYFIFKDPKNYMVLWQITGDTSLTEKIIDSIVY